MICFGSLEFGGPLIFMLRSLLSTMDVFYLDVYSRVIRPKVNHNRLLKKKTPGRETRGFY